jgi:hypothetical protein
MRDSTDRPTGLSPTQRHALAILADRCDGPALDPQLRVTINFHPDRLHRGQPVLHWLAHDACYRSQFETGTSNGGLTAHAGGARWLWESRIFGGAYDGAPAHERPKYGALDHRRTGVGGSPRFGSAHLRLAASVVQRSTFCFPDSVFEPTRFGVAARCGLVEIAARDRRDRLDHYVEAHVHGALRIPGDIEALVLDPCYRGTSIETLAARLGCAVEWHAGFALDASAWRDLGAYRGEHIAELGLALANGGVLTPLQIGEAARTGRYDPQHLKQVWHCLARYGDNSWPASSAGAELPG